MHNLHIGLVYAETGEEACNSVESSIETWGDENNWRTICGAVSEDGNYETEDGRYPPNVCDTLDKINEMVRKNWMASSFFGQNGKSHIEKFVKEKKLNAHEWWEVIQYAKHMESVASVEEQGDGDFDIRKKHEFMTWKLSECGVTNLGAWADECPEGEKLWAVFIDMHS